MASGTTTDRARPARWRAAVVLLVAATGCTNLTAIQQFAALSAESVAYRQLVDDYVTAPERRARLAPRPGAVSSGETATRRAQAQGLLQQQAALEAYLDALGRLAADETVGYAAEFGALSGAVASARFARPADAAAAATLAELLTRAAIDGWRRRRLEEVIAAANPPVQELAGGLGTVARGLALDLRNEQLAATSWAETLARSSRDRAAVAMVREWQAATDQRLARRAEGLAAYQQALDRIAAGHQALFEARGRLADADTARRIAGYARELRAAVRVLQETR